MMGLLLAIPLLFGYFIATRVLREKDWLSIPVLSFALALAGTLFFVNPLAYVLPLSASMYVALGVMAAACLALRLKKAEGLHHEPLCRSHLMALCACSLLILVFANYLQTIKLDDDYWIHTSLMGLFQKGQFPPCNPFFPSIELPGHYGRDLTISALSCLTGGDFLTMQWVLTDLMEPAMFLLIFIWVRRSGRDSLQALFCAIFCFFAVNTGARAGLMDIIQNNNPFVYLYLFLIIHLFTCALQEKNTGALVLCGLILGIYPVVYETHYGLLCLTFCAMALYLALKERKFNLRPLAVVSLILALSVPLALLSGGIFTAKLRQGGAAAPKMAASEISTSQKVSITFPKKELLQIYLSPEETQRVSVCFPAFYPRFHDRKYFSDFRYAALWSPSFLLLVWFPFYLAPLTLVLLLWRRNQAGLMMWLFGFFSIMVPALVNFGPVFEEEYFRWVGAAGIGFAGALGVSVALLMPKVPGGARYTGRQKCALAGLVLFMLLNFIGALTYVNYMFIDYQKLLTHREGRIKATRCGFPDPLGHLMALGRKFQPLDLKACAFLRQNTSKGDTALRHFDEHDALDLYPEATVAGLAGVNMVGHASPPFLTELRASPFRMNHRARAFWTTGDPLYLQDMGVCWLYVDPSGISDEVFDNIKQCPSLRLVFDETAQDGSMRQIYQNLDWRGCRPSFQPELPREVKAMEHMTLMPFPLPDRLKTCTCYLVELKLASRENLPAGSMLTCQFFDHKTGKPAAASDRIQVPLMPPPAGKPAAVRFCLVTPYQQGLYDLEFYLVQQDRVFRIEPGLHNLKVEAADDEQHQ